MTDRHNVHPVEHPLEQHNIAALAEAGYVLHLLLEHRVDDRGVSRYYLYAKYRKRLRQIYTQRHAHRYYTNLARAIDWGKRVGFKSVSVNIDYGEYPDTAETAR